jgi:hypothetical protein
LFGLLQIATHIPLNGATPNPKPKSWKSKKLIVVTKFMHKCTLGKNV